MLTLVVGTPYSDALLPTIIPAAYLDARSHLLPRGWDSECGGCAAGVLRCGADGCMPVIMNGSLSSVSVFAQAQYVQEPTLGIPTPINVSVSVEDWLRVPEWALPANATDINAVKELLRKPRLHVDVSKGPVYPGLDGKGFLIEVSQGSKNIIIFNFDLQAALPGVWTLRFELPSVSDQICSPSAGLASGENVDVRIASPVGVVSGPSSTCSISAAERAASAEYFFSILAVRVLESVEVVMVPTHPIHLGVAFVVSALQFLMRQWYLSTVRA